MWQELAVAVIVALATLYLGGKYLPDGWRRAIVGRLSQDARRGNRLAARLVTWLDTSGSCGTGCGSCASGNAKATAPSGKGKVIQIHRR